MTPHPRARLASQPHPRPHPGSAGTASHDRRSWPLDPDAVFGDRPAPPRAGWRADATPEAALSYGLGADSTAILLRWLDQPVTAPCDLEDLIVVTAMTGDEWAITGRLVEEHVLPRLSASRVRYAQVARAGPRQADGVVILDDSRTPERLRLGGAFRLSDELRTAGTIPQVAGPRKCSAKAKGQVIDTYLARVTAGAPFLHAMGYETGEMSRADRDTTYNTPARTGIYPLITWGWDRAASEDYIYTQTGVHWPKSACTYCVFALATSTGRARILDLYLGQPDAAIRDLMLEHSALSLNPRQGLAGDGTLAALLATTGRHDQILRQFAAHLHAAPWQVCEVRRAIRPSPADPARAGTATRSLRILASGSQPVMHGELVALAATARVPLATGADRITRAWLRHRVGRYPDAEHFLVAVPAGPQAKDGPGFARAWREATAQPPGYPRSARRAA
jgi:hypothetical protein